MFDQLQECIGDVEDIAQFILDVVQNGIQFVQDTVAGLEPVAQAILDLGQDQLLALVNWATCVLLGPAGCDDTPPI